MRSQPLRIMSIVGARPNMMKIAPLMEEMRRHAGIEPVVVHTGQHYDYAMSQVFFDDLQMPAPDYNLGVGSGTHYEQTAEILRRFGELVQRDRPDMVVVAGDVNSTLACALVAVKEGIPLAHVEAGLRSFDRSMPEEINRVVTDSVSDWLFTTETSGNQNLANEGVPGSKVFFVGNLMIDSVVKALARVPSCCLRTELGLAAQPYVLLTLHRPANVDQEDRLRATLEVMRELAEKLPVIFPAHPRTARNIEVAGIHGIRTWEGGAIAGQGLWMLPPAAYLDFLDLLQHAQVVITDSGGVQEEATFLRVPCLTFRKHTERPVTVSLGTNRVVGDNPRDLLRHALNALAAGKERRSAAVRPPLWDGQTAPRIVSVLMEAWQKKAARWTEVAPVV
jgi:UDP-N-acetylglucosamine 2-epimerase (non-hydrolysing)